MRNFTLFTLFIVFLFSCTSEEEPTYLSVEGKTMGTYYKVTYFDSLQRNFKKPIDSLLFAINLEISSYEPFSTVSMFNHAKEEFELGLKFKDYAECMADYRYCKKIKNRHFQANFLIAKVVNQRTRQAFDPTVMPLVNYWGFGYTPKRAITQVDSLKIDSLKQYVGFEKVKMRDKNGYAVLRKTSPGIQLDFGGTGQGYGIDAVSVFLEQKGIKNYLVDIGGESRARGKNPRETWWTIGINTPSSEAAVTDYEQVIELRNMAVSTSGNYRNFYEVDGKKYSHFISPFTGFPEKNSLLSATVFGKNCLYPDALATGFMVMGVDKAFTLASQLEGIEALFIYSDGAGEMKMKYTDGVEDFFIVNE